MKWQITILFILIFSISSVAQKILLSEVPEEIIANSGSKVSNSLKIKNISDDTVRLAVSIINSQLASSQKINLCYNDNCLDEQGNGLDIIAIPPGTTIKNLEVQFTAGLDESESSIEYLFVDIDNPREAIAHTFQYKVRSVSPNGIMYTGNGISVSNAYPNPVADVATIDFNMENTFEDAKLVFHNVLGDKVAEVPLNRFESSVKIPTDGLQIGVYFYTLYLDSKGVITKKLIVRK